MTSRINPSLLSEVGLTTGSAAVAAELRKRSGNDATVQWCSPKDAITHISHEWYIIVSCQLHF